MSAKSSTVFSDEHVSNIIYQAYVSFCITDCMFNHIMFRDGIFTAELTANHVTSTDLLWDATILQMPDLFPILCKAKNMSPKRLLICQPRHLELSLRQTNSNLPFLSFSDWNSKLTSTPHLLNSQPGVYSPHLCFDVIFDFAISFIRFQHNKRRK